jgi:hypothetical protein
MQLTCHPYISLSSCATSPSSRALRCQRQQTAVGDDSDDEACVGVVWGGAGGDGHSVGRLELRDWDGGFLRGPLPLGRRCIMSRQAACCIDTGALNDHQLVGEPLWRACLAERARTGLVTAPTPWQHTEYVRATVRPTPSERRAHGVRAAARVLAPVQVQAAGECSGEGGVRTQAHPALV